MEVSNFVKSAKFSAIRFMFNEASKVEDTVSFSMGEPDFDTPAVVIEEACRQWHNHKTHYTPNKGILPLRKAVAKYHKDNLNPDPEKNVCISNGGSDALRIALRAILNDGDEVICVTPCWANYFAQVAMYGGKVVEVPSYEENDFNANVDDIINAITDKTKAIMLNYPCNPTGAILSEETAKGIAQIIHEREIYLISDEVYSRFVYGGKKHVSVIDYLGEEDMEKVIYLNSFSKLFAMTGWRLAYIIANEKIIDGMGHITECGPSCFPEPTQWAAIKALECCKEDTDRFYETFSKRRELMCSLLDDMPLITYRKPMGAFYIFANIKATGMNDFDFCLDLLHKTGVVVVPGSGFGDAGNGYVRISYTVADEEIIEGMARLKKYLEELQASMN